MSTNTPQEQSPDLQSQANAIANLPPELAMMKIENDTIQSLAAARPRNHKTILANIKSQLEAYPSFAKAAIYNKPVGKDEHGVMKYARGLGVRASEAIAEAYGYCRVHADVIPIDDNSVKLTASFTDYQQGRIWSDSAIVSKYYTSKYGKLTKHKEDRFWNVVVKAEKSKLIREVILRSVPPGLRTELQAAAEETIASLLDDDAVKKIMDSFSGLGVTLVQLEKLIGRSYKSGWTKTDRMNLITIWNAIEQNETTVDEVFGDKPDKKPDKEKEGATAEDLTGSTPKTSAGEKKSDEEKATGGKSKSTKKGSSAKSKTEDIDQEPKDSIPESLFDRYQSDVKHANNLELLGQIQKEGLADIKAKKVIMEEWKVLVAQIDLRKKSLTADKSEEKPG